jgi:hypothetical protein
VQVGRTEVTELLEYYFSFVLLPSSRFSKPHLHKAVTVMGNHFCSSCGLVLSEPLL